MPDLPDPYRPLTSEELKNKYPPEAYRNMYRPLTSEQLEETQDLAKLNLRGKPRTEISLPAVLLMSLVFWLGVLGIVEICCWIVQSVEWLAR